MIIYWKIFYADRTDHKSHERSVFLNTKEISAIDKILVDIALEKQSLFDNSKLFIPLRPLFVTLAPGENIPFKKSDGKFTCVMNLYTIYREDQDGNEIDYSQFQSILRGENITIYPNSSCLHGRSISEEDLNRSIVWNNHPLNKKDFYFSSQDIEVLKLFCEDAKLLRESRFLAKDSLPSFYYIVDNNRPYQINYKIDESERNAAYIIFRRLIMENEKACFFKARKIILDKRKNKHSSFDILCAKGKKINSIWKNQGEEIFFAKGLLHMIPELHNICWGHFINAVLNHGLFHQKDMDKTQVEYEQYEKIVNHKLTFEALFYVGVHDIASQICDFANYIEDILQELNVDTEISHPAKRHSLAQDEFEKFITDKIGELAFIFAKEEGISSYTKAKNRAHEFLHKFFQGKIFD